MSQLPTIGAIAIYVSILSGISFFSYRRHKTASDFIIGSRSLNFYLTALAAHSSDMSSWLFMGFPAAIYQGGLFSAWFAIGLTACMLLNWLIVAPRIRTRTEHYKSLTLSSFFERRFNDLSGRIRIFTAVISFIFYTIYISAGITGLGLIINTLFGIPYVVGISLGVCIIIPYLCIGGYTTLAWLDLFQGLFLMVVIAIVPCIIITKVGGFAGVAHALHTFEKSSSLLPNLHFRTFTHIFFNICGWGLGYFGQPHIITKFMGIRKVRDLRKATLVGIGWQTITMTAATMIGLIAIAYFNNSLHNPELAFVTMVNQTFPRMLAAFILCAVLAAIFSTMDSQILVLASSLTEDFYKKIFRPGASSGELLRISRLFVIVTAAVSYLIALKTQTIYSIVLYAWSGLGSAFGPLTLFALYAKKVNGHGAWAGILTGGIIAMVWPAFNKTIFSLLPGFVCSSLAIFLFSRLTSSTPRKG
ncbi:MAG: sodium/proline symporter [Simkaniaceae bacterium]|nr:sodium/proline symporter [Simkaniaceae bacterium]